MAWVLVFFWASLAVVGGFEFRQASHGLVFWLFFMAQTRFLPLDPVACLGQAIHEEFPEWGVSWFKTSGGQKLPTLRMRLICPVLATFSMWSILSWVTFDSWETHRMAGAKVRPTLWFNLQLLLQTCHSSPVHRNQDILIRTISNLSSGFSARSIKLCSGVITYFDLIKILDWHHIVTIVAMRSIRAQFALKSHLGPP